VLNSVLLAGELELVTREVRGRRVLAAIAGRDWGFDAAAFADAVSSIDAFQRGFFEDEGRAFLLAALVPVGRPAKGLVSWHGRALTQSFTLRIPPGSELDEAMQLLIAHELFHSWTRNALAPAARSDIARWFSEGFTEFYARRLLARSGAITRPEWLSSLNYTLADYFSSAARNAPNSAIGAGRLHDQDLHRLPYLRGEIIALLVDRAIHRASQGRASLDDLMRELVRGARAKGQRYSTEDLLQRIAHWAGDASAASVRAIVERGESPRLDPRLFEPCFELYGIQAGPFDPGFDLERSVADWIVHDVREGSVAWQMGLREGWDLLGFRVDQDQDGRRVSLHLRADQAEFWFIYPPIGECRVEVPQLRLREGVDPGACTDA